MAIGNIQKWGNSQGIRIPKNVLQAVGLRDGDAVEIVTVEDRITIQKVKRIPSLDALFEGYTGDYRPGEDDAGDPVGREVW